MRRYGRTGRGQGAQWIAVNAWGGAGIFPTFVVLTKVWNGCQDREKSQASPSLPWARRAVTGRGGLTRRQQHHHHHARAEQPGYEALHRTSRAGPAGVSQRL
jgi:hypothetical protein